MATEATVSRARKETPRQRAAAWAVALGLFVGGWALLRACDAQTARRQQAAQLRQAPAYLEGSNALRRRAGLWPVTPDFKWRDYSTSTGDPDVYSVSLRRDEGRYPPYPEEKVVGYNPERRQLLWEFEFINSASPGQHPTPEYTLKRVYSYANAAQGGNPWALTLRSSRGRTDTLSAAQTDSVLRAWRVLGQRDSLAQVAQRLPHK